MKRTELTSQAMKDMGWKPLDPNDLRIKDIVFNIQARNDDGSWFWKLRCVDGRKFTRTEFGMCSTYDVTYKKEYLEVSADGTSWNAVAERDVRVGSRCVYAD